MWSFVGGGGFGGFGVVDLGAGSLFGGVRCGDCRGAGSGGGGSGSGVGLLLLVMVPGSGGI